MTHAQPPQNPVTPAVRQHRHLQSNLLPCASGSRGLGKKAGEVGSSLAAVPLIFELGNTTVGMRETEALSNLHWLLPLYEAAPAALSSKAHFLLSAPFAVWVEISCSRVGPGCAFGRSSVSLVTAPVPRGLENRGGRNRLTES